MNPKIGDILDGYKLLAENGSGSCGIVFQAQNIISGELFALKLFSSHGSLAEQELHAVRLYQKIDHPNLIRIHHVGQTDDSFFYTMDWCECSLAQRKVSADELLSIAKKLASALKTLHEHGLIHRDVKPDNIFFRKGEIVLGDIGLVAKQENAVSAGSRGFLAPELLNGSGKANPYTDCYAFAKTIYCALSGESPEKFPFYEGSLSETASLLMRAVLAVCSDKPRIRTAEDFLRFLENPKSAAHPQKSKLWLLSAAFLILFSVAWVIFIFKGSVMKQRKVPFYPKNKSAKIEHETRQPQQSPKGEENGEITVRRAWNEQNKLLIQQTASRIRRSELEFEIEWNELRINLLERSAAGQITESDFNREDRNLTGLWKIAKWLLKSGIDAETLDQDYGELKPKLEIHDAEMNRKWHDADRKWKNDKEARIKELLQRMKDTGKNPADILREMAEKDAALRFFGIEQPEYLGKYEKTRFSGRQDAKHECDESIAGYLKCRDRFLQSQKNGN